MKNYTSTLLKATALVLVLGLAFIGKNSLWKEYTSEGSIPELLQRGEKIQLGKEWDYVQNAYSDTKNAILSSKKVGESRIRMAQLFIKEARVTGEHGHYYPAALQMLDAVLNQKKLDRDIEFLALMHKAGVQLSLHEFANALSTGNKAALLNPSNAQVHGVLVDAHVELGNYEKAIKLADRMMSIKPDIRSYSRVSYLREIHGDVNGSIEAMKMAVKSGYPGYEETAWAMLTLGDLFTEYGYLEKAEKVYTDILQTRENYPFAVGALANIHYLRGDLDKAEDTYINAMNIIPEVGFYVSLAAIYKEQGREAEMEKLMQEIFTMLQDDVESGHNMNLEYAHIYLDILDDVDNALRYIEKEYKKRPNNIDVNLMMAKVSKRKGDIESQEKYLAMAQKTNSKRPELLELMEERMY